MALPFFGIWMKTDFFQSCGHCWAFQTCWHIKCSTFTATTFRMWNSSTKIPSTPLTLFIVMHLEKAEESENKLPAFIGSSKKQESYRKISALLTTPKPLTVWITANCWKFLEMGIPDHLTCVLRNLYAGQEATVRTGHETTDWLQIGKGVCQGCILSPYLFNLYAEYIMQNAGLEEAQAGIKIARRTIK